MRNCDDVLESVPDLAASLFDGFLYGQFGGSKFFGGKPQSSACASSSAHFGR
ncbi:MAG: hypothetical protein J6S69_06625 [Proteobacteria bacterium]|nr:hypothetical protein [Pseudomonadota bacterium]